MPQEKQKSLDTYFQGAEKRASELDKYFQDAEGRVQKEQQGFEDYLAGAAKRTGLSPAQEALGYGAAAVAETSAAVLQAGVVDPLWGLTQTIVRGIGLFRPEPEEVPLGQAMHQDQKAAAQESFELVGPRPPSRADEWMSAPNVRELYGLLVTGDRKYFDKVAAAASPAWRTATNISRSAGQVGGFIAGASGKALSAATVKGAQLLSRAGIKTGSTLLAGSAGFAAEAYVRTGSMEQGGQAAMWGPLFLLSGRLADAQMLKRVMSFLPKPASGFVRQGFVAGGLGFGVAPDAVKLALKQAGLAYEDQSFQEIAPLLANAYHLHYELLPALEDAVGRGDIKEIKALEGAIEKTKTALGEARDHFWGATVAMGLRGAAKPGETFPRKHEQEAEAEMAKEAVIGKAVEPVKPPMEAEALARKEGISPEPVSDVGAAPKPQKMVEAVPQPKVSPERIKALQEATREIRTVVAKREKQGEFDLDLMRKLHPPKKGNEKIADETEGGFIRLWGEDPPGTTAEFRGKQGGIRGWVTRNMKTAANWASENLGEGGKRLAKGIYKIDRRHEGQTQTDLQALDVIAPKKTVPDKNIELANLYMNERRTAEQVGPEIVKLADQMRAVYDRVRAEAKATGVKTVHGKELTFTGKAYSEQLNREGRKVMDLVEAGKEGDQRVRKAAEAMVTEGRAKDVPGALRMFANYMKQVKQFDPYLQGIRTQLPEHLIEWNARKTMEPVLRRAWLRTEGAREFGPKFERGDEALAEIVEQFGTGPAIRMRDFLQGEFGRDPYAVPAEHRTWKGISNAISIAKLAPSIVGAMRNWFQPVPNNSLYPFWYTLSAHGEFPPIGRYFMRKAIEIRKQSERAGSVRSSGTFSELEMGPLSELAKKVMPHWTEAEVENQVKTTITAWRGMEADLKQLIGRDTKGQTKLTKMYDALGRVIGVDYASAKSRLKTLGVTDAEIQKAIETGKWTPEQYEAAGYRFVIDTQFPLTMATRHIWEHRFPWARLSIKFKRFGIRQTGLLRKHGIAQAARGNVAPLAQYLMGSIMVGEVYNLIRDVLEGRDRSLTGLIARGKGTTREYGQRLLNNFVQGGAFGMVADMMFGFGDWIVGPPGGVFEDITKAAAHTVEAPTMAPEAMGQMLERLVSTRQFYGIWDQIERVAGKEENIAAKMARWRERVRNLKLAEKKPGVGGLITEELSRFFQGHPRYEVGEDTLALQLAGSQVRIGDIDDAVGYMAIVLRKAKDYDDYQARVTKIRQSMSSKSPLAGAKKGRFRGQMRQRYADDWAEGEVLERQWRRQWETALGKAQKIVGTERSKKRSK